MKYHFNPIGFVLPGLLGLTLILTGCKSTSVEHYISPRITGKVIDAQTHEPVKGVKVQRVPPESVVRSDEPLKGGEVMQGERGTSTRANGTFVLQSKKDIALVAEAGWDEVTVSFSRSGYTTLLRTYPKARAVRSAAGEPMINAGVVLLMPSTK